MVKPLALNEIRIRAGRFVREWQDSPGDERQDAQSFVRDLLAVYGVTETKAAFYEKRVRRSSTGQRGYIDALVPGTALIEMKSAGKDLVKAERQALDYIDDLPPAETPRFVLTSDFHTFRLLDIEAPDGEDILTFSLADFPQHADRLRFFAGYALTAPTAAEQEAASVKAARLMAGLYEALEGSGYSDHEASVFLVRTLFSLYADDSGVWEKDLYFQFLVDRTAEDGSDLGPQLTHLYQVMAQPVTSRQSNLDELIARFPYVNGGIFEQTLSIPSFDQEMRARLLEACLFNWAAISPAVFGSLFQAVKDRTARRVLGEHYTTEKNILRLIGPMFLDALRERFDAAKDDAAKLRALRREMGAMRFLDPACGCGNFIVVAYREMRALDLEVLVRLQELQAARAGGRRTDTTFVPSLLFDVDDLPVRLENFHGIELEEWPAQIATTALHLIEHQANQAMEVALGVGPEPLPLHKIESIHVGNALRTDWTDVIAPTDRLFVMGNPPFLGHKERTASQGDDLRLVWRTDRIGHLNYVTGWYAKTLDLFARDGYAGEFAFVSTNAITLGDSVPQLFQPIFEAGWRIKFAHRTFRWTSEAPGKAQVHCVIIGFDKGATRAGGTRLFHYEHGATEALESKPQQINAYLAAGPNIFVLPRRAPLSPEVPPIFAGSTPIDWGHLIVAASEYDDVVADPVAAKYLRRYAGGKELINGIERWCLWLVDASPREIASSRVLRERVERVKSARLAPEVTRQATRDLASTPHLFGERRQPQGPYLGLPQAFARARDYATAARLDKDVIASIKLFTAPDRDGLLFGLVSSSMFMAWQRTVGQRTPNNQYSLTASVVWNNFPVPALTDTQRGAIIAGGRRVLDARGLHPERSLSDQYSPLSMDPELVGAHRALDSAVDRAFGLRGAVHEADRLRVLFEGYQRMSTSGQLSLARTTRGRKVT